MTFSVGKPGATKQDVLDALAKGDGPDPLAWVRSVVGDTMTTRKEIVGYTDARKAIGC